MQGFRSSEGQKNHIFSTTKGNFSRNVGLLTLLETVGSLAREKESLLGDRRSQQVMSPPSLQELRLVPLRSAGITRSAGLPALRGAAAGRRD